MRARLSQRLDLLSEKLQAIADSEDDSFLSLVSRIGLDPETDFVGADLRGADLRKLDLSSFDFSGADLRGALVEGTTFSARSLANAIGINKISSPTTSSVQWSETGNAPPDDPPDEAIKLMQVMRKNPSYIEYMSALRELLSKYASYQPPRWLDRIKHRLIAPSGTGGPTWLRNFLIERVASGRWREAVDLSRDAYQTIFSELMPEQEILEQKALSRQMPTERVDAVNALNEEYGDREEVQSLFEYLACRDPDDRVREVALGKIRLHTDRLDAFRNFMLDRYHQDQKSGPRAVALLQLAAFRHTDDEILNLIVKSAADMESVAERAAAILAIEDLLPTSPLYQQLFLQSIFGPTDGAKINALAVLSRTIKGLPEARAIFMNLYNKSDDLTKLHITRHMMEHFVPDDKLFQLARDALASDDPIEEGTQHARQCIRILGDHFMDKPGVFDTLMKLAAGSRHPWIRREALGQVSARFSLESRVRTLIYDRALSDAHLHVRWIALEIVAEHKDDDDRASAVLKQAYERMPSDFFYARAARKALGVKTNEVANAVTKRED